MGMEAILEKRPRNTSRLQEELARGFSSFEVLDYRGERKEDSGSAFILSYGYGEGLIPVIAHQCEER